MIDPDEFRALVIRPVLKHLGANFEADPATALLFGTALAESGLSHLKQIRGPALGVYQMEPDTLEDLQYSYLRYRPVLDAKFSKCFFSAVPWLTQFPSNLWAQTAAARLHYWRDPEPIPADVEGMARYYKRVWNTAAGKATLSKVMWAFRQAVEN